MRASAPRRLALVVAASGYAVGAAMAVLATADVNRGTAASVAMLSAVVAVAASFAALLIGQRIVMARIESLVSDVDADRTARERALKATTKRVQDSTEAQLHELRSSLLWSLQSTLLAEPDAEQSVRDSG